MINIVENLENAAGLFNGWSETMIWSCVQGIMGSVYSDDKYRTAVAAIGDFCFFAGNPDIYAVKYIIENSGREYTIAVPQNELWEKAIEEAYPDKAVKIERYAFKKHCDFDVKRLAAAVNSLGKEYTIKMIDENLYNMCKASKWSKDLVSNYKDFDNYKNNGIGYVIMHENKIVCGASSYSSYKGGIEIEIDTREDFRKRGLAYICGAKLILECLKRNIFPSWDAHNTASARLAEKLGYYFDYAYTAYEI